MSKTAEAVGETSKEVQNLPQNNETVSIETLLSQAIKNKVPVDTMERLLNMRKDLRAEHAKEQYNKAMAAFQSECPTIEKTKEVKMRSGAVAYRYAPIESIVSQVKTLLVKHGFSYSTKMELLESGVIVTCRVTHEAGHSEESPMQVPLGKKTDIMSDSQVVAAAQTFAKRYAFCNAFGILTGDDDTDTTPNTPPRAISATKEPVTHEAQIKKDISAKMRTLAPDVSAETIHTKVKELTQLELKAENYEEINNMLQILIEEKEEAKSNG